MSRLRYTSDFLRATAKEQVDKIEALISSPTLIKPITYRNTSELDTSTLNSITNKLDAKLANKSSYIQNAINDDIVMSINKNLDLADNLGVAFTPFMKEKIRQPQSLFDMIESNKQQGHLADIQDLNWIKNTIKEDFTLNPEVKLRPKVRFNEDLLGSDVNSPQNAFRLQRYIDAESDLVHGIANRSRFKLVDEESKDPFTNLYYRILNNKIQQTQLDDIIDIEASVLSDIVQLTIKEKNVYNKVLDLIDEPITLGGQELASAIQAELKRRELPDLLRLAAGEINPVNVLDLKVDKLVDNIEPQIVNRLQKIWDQNEAELFNFEVDYEDIILRSKPNLSLVPKYQGGLVSANPRLYPDHIFYFIENLQSYYNAKKLDPAGSVGDYLSGI